MIILILSLTTIVVFLIYYHLTNQFDHWKKKNVPGPAPVTFFGNIKDSVLRRRPIGLIYKEAYNTYKNEKIVGMFRMRTPALLVRDLDLVKHIFIKDFDVFPSRGIELGKGGLGDNLFHTDGDTWRVLRNRFTPLFTSGKLRSMLYLLTERGDKFVDYVERICEKNPEQEVHGLVQKFTQATIAACAFGLDIDTINQRENRLDRIDKKIFTLNYGAELDFMYPGILKKIGGSTFPAEVKTFFYDLTKNIIKERNGKPSNRNDFMDLILSLRESKQIEGPKKDQNDKTRVLEITENIISAQSFVFYAAGYETSASTMGFMLYQLALNPDVQDKLLSEIDSVMDKYEGKVTLEALSEMTYMGKVFDETLRMYPIVDNVKRKAESDYKIPGTDVTLDKGQVAIVSALSIHYDENIYPNPDVFDPERFSPENTAARHSCAYLPFGLGPRNCIGMRFAQVQSKVCISKLLSKFRVEPSHNTKRYFEFEPTRLVLYPKGGFYLNFVRRR